MAFEVLTPDEVHDLLIELPHLDETKYYFILEGTKFVADAEEAHEFCMEYGSDTYSQAMSGINSKEMLLVAINHGYFGSVIKKV